MEWIGVIGIVAGLVFFVIAAMRGWNVLITSIVTAIIIALTNGMDIMNTMVGTETSYATGLAGFIRGNLMIFMGGAIMGSGSGAVGIIAQNFLEPYLATGVDPAALAKIIATSATIGGALPNSGAMFGMLAAMGLNHKNSYKHIAAISIGAGMCALVVMIIMANVGIY